MGNLKKGKEKIFQEFLDRRSSVVVGILCFVYFILHFTSHLGEILASILPPLSQGVFFGIGAAVLILQVVTWKILQLFYPRWFFNFWALILFFSEYTLSLFAIVVISWPIYFIIGYATHSAHRF